MPQARNIIFIYVNWNVDRDSVDVPDRLLQLRALGNYIHIVFVKYGGEDESQVKGTVHPLGADPLHIHGDCLGDTDQRHCPIGGLQIYNCLHNY